MTAARRMLGIESHFPTCCNWISCYARGKSESSQNSLAGYQTEPNSHTEAFMSNRTAIVLLAAVMVVGCDREKGNSLGGNSQSSSSSGMTLNDARKGFQTKVSRQGGQREAVEKPPANLFKIVR